MQIVSSDAETFRGAEWKSGLSCRTEITLGQVLPVSHGVFKDCGTIIRFGFTDLVSLTLRIFENRIALPIDNEKVDRKVNRESVVERLSVFQIQNSDLPACWRQMLGGKMAATMVHGLLGMQGMRNPLAFLEGTDGGAMDALQLPLQGAASVERLRNRGIFVRASTRLGRSSPRGSAPGDAHPSESTNER